MLSPPNGSPQSSLSAVGRTWKGQPDLKARAVPDFAVCLDRSAVRSDDAMDDRQAEAMAAYQRLTSPGFPRPIRLAAVQGVLNASGDGAPDMVLAMLASDDAVQRTIAAGQVGNVLREETIQSFVNELPKLSAPSQILLLGALAAHGGSAVVPRG